MLTVNESVGHPVVMTLRTEVCAAPACSPTSSDTQDVSSDAAMLYLSQTILKVSNVDIWVRSEKHDVSHP